MTFRGKAIARLALAASVFMAAVLSVWGPADIAHAQGKGKGGGGKQGKVAPAQVREPKIEIAQRASQGDVCQAVAVAGAPDALAQIVRSDSQRGLDLLVVAIDPLGALLLRRPAALEHDCSRRIQQAVSECFPALDVNTLASRLGDQFTHGRHGIQIFHDHAGIVDGCAVIGEQHRDLAERIPVRELRRRVEWIDQNEFVFDALFGERDARLAHEGTGAGADQFHRFEARFLE